MNVAAKGPTSLHYMQALSVGPSPIVPRGGHKRILPGKSSFPLKTIRTFICLVPPQFLRISTTKNENFEETVPTTQYRIV